MKIVINTWDEGGFGLSREALHELRKLGNQDALEEIDIGEPWVGTKELRRELKGADDFLWDIRRDDPDLIRVIEKLGKKANGPSSHLKIIEIPDGIEWRVQSMDSDYDGSGKEWIVEIHREWS